MLTLTPGTRLGVFEILATLGEGGMGAVYRARDTQLNRDVAIKVLLPAIADDPNRLARFEREAQVLASLNHPNIAAIYGLEAIGGNRALVLEMVDGPTLAERIEKGPIAFDESLAIARQIADALAAAHDQGIVHRDLKPANIKLRPDGTVKVLDFGLAKAMDPAAAASGSATMSPTLSMHATMAGVILGTAAYMSPEQASGKTVDKRADIWAFGVVLFEMVTSRRLFEGETISHVLAAVLTSTPNLTAAPLRVRRLLERCLEKDPRKRLRDVGDAMSLVDDMTIQSPVAARRGSPSAIAWTMAGALAVALAVAVWMRPQPDTADPPAVRLQIERTSVDPYNNSTLAFSLSPDGRFLAFYTSATNGQATLSVQTLATGERREIPGSVVISPGTPFWSPDSRHVAYLTALTTSAFDLVTATTRELCACRSRGGSWNRDGVILLGSPSNAAEPIRRVSLDDRTPVALTKTGGGEQDSLPVFLPDGQRFLFTRTTPGSGTATYVSDLAGMAPTRISDGSRSALVTLPGALGPHLLGIDGAGLMAQAIDLDTMTVTGEPVIVVAVAVAASVSSNGVLATSTAATRRITLPTWFDRQGMSLGALGTSGAIQSIALASNGRTVAVQDLREDGQGISLRDAAGANRRLTTEGGDAPVWSPDATRILMARRIQAVVNIFERAADGSGREVRLFTAERNTYPNDWSPDGRWVMFTIPKAGSELDLDLWVVRADAEGDRKPVAFVTSPARETQAEFSPDGKFVAYTSVTSGEPEVYVQPFPSASDGKWLVSSGGGSEPHWSRDGKELFYIAGQTLMSVPVTLRPTFSSGIPTRLFDTPVQPWYTNDSDRSQVAPDGKRFLLLVPTGKTAAPPIDVVVNWPTLLKK